MRGHTDAGHTLNDVSFIRAEHEGATALIERTVHKLGQAVKHCGLEGEGDVVIALLYALCHMGLSRHTTAYTDDEVGLQFTKGLEITYDGECLKLGVAAYSAGVDDDEVGLLWLIGQGVAHLNCHRAHLLTVCLVLLTAERDDVGVLIFALVECFYTLYIF